MDVKTLSEIIANQGFLIALSILLIFRIDRFMQEIVTAQKEGYRQILENTKEIHNTITNFNQQNREYYSCLLYTSDAADEEDSVDLGGRRIIKKKKTKKHKK